MMTCFVKKIFYVTTLLFVFSLPAYGHLDKLGKELLGDIYYFADNGKLKETIIELDSRIKNDPNQSANYFNRAIAYYEYYCMNPLHFGPPEDISKNWHAIAFADAQKAVELDPNFAEAYWIRGKLQVELLKTLEDYLTSIHINDKFVEGYISLFEYYTYDKEDKKKAFKYINIAIGLGSDKAAYKRAWYHFDRKQYKEGLKWMTKAIELNPDNESYYSRRAEFYHALKDDKSAISDILRSSGIKKADNVDIPETELKEILAKFLKVSSPPVNFIEIISEDTVRIDSGVTGFGDNSNTFEKVGGVWIENKSKRVHIIF